MLKLVIRICPRKWSSPGNIGRGLILYTKDYMTPEGATNVVFMAICMFYALDFRGNLWFSK